MAPGARITAPQPPKARLALLDRLDDQIRREVDVGAAWSQLLDPAVSP